MRQKIDRLEQEAELVSWYVEIMEQGIDTKQLLKEYTELKRKHRSLTETSTKQIERLERKYSKVKLDLKEAL